MVSYVALMLSLFVPNLLFWCLWMDLIRNCAFPGYFHLYFLCLNAMMASCIYKYYDGYFYV